MKGSVPDLETTIEESRSPIPVGCNFRNERISLVHQYRTIGFRVVSTTIWPIFSRGVGGIIIRPLIKGVLDPHNVLIVR